MNNRPPVFTTIHPIVLGDTTSKNENWLRSLVGKLRNKYNGLRSDRQKILEKLKDASFKKMRSAWKRRLQLLNGEMKKYMNSIQLFEDLISLNGYVARWNHQQAVLQFRDSCITSHPLVDGETLAIDSKFRARTQANLYALRLKRVQLSQKITGALGGCCDDFREFVRTQFCKCILCPVLCHKKWIKLCGLASDLSKKGQNGIEERFLCFDCAQGLYGAAKAYMNQQLDTRNAPVALPTSETFTAIVSDSITSTPSLTRPTPSKRKMKKKKSTQEVGDSNVSGSKMVGEQNCQDVHSRLMTDDIENTHPSNDELLNHLMQTGSIVALNAFLDQFEEKATKATRGPELVVSPLEKPLLEEFRDECLAVTTSTMHPTDLKERSKTTEAARKGYRIAVGMLAEIDNSAVISKQP